MIKADEIIEQRFESLLSRYLISYGYVPSLYYKRHKINLNCDGSYINSPDCTKKKIATIHPVTEDDKCFQ